LKSPSQILCSLANTFADIRTVPFSRVRRDALPTVGQPSRLAPADTHHSKK
jgi:hypothetical protein